MTSMYGINGLPEGVTAAVIYNRVSHAKRSISVEAQNQLNHEACERLNLPVRKVFKDDGKSASRYSTKVRTDWDDLKSGTEGLRKGDMLVCWASSRAQRDLGEFVELRNLCAGLGVPFFYSGRIVDFTRGDDRYYAGMDALRDEHLSEQIMENVRRGKNTAAAAGHPPGRAPWGYRMAPRSPGEPPRWVQDPVEAPRVREAVERLLKGASMYSVRDWLARTEGGAPTTLTGLKRSLSKPSLAGLRVHQGRVIGDGTWDAIITPEQHYQLVEQLDRGPQPSRGREPKYLLTGIAKCGICGEGVRWKLSKHNPNASYDCSRSHCSREVGAMEAAVVRYLFGLIPLLVAVAPRDTFAADHKDADRKIRELKSTLAQWRQAAISGDVTPTSFGEIEKGLLLQIEELRPKAAVITIPDPDDLRAKWGTMSMRERREQIRRFLTIKVIPAERRGCRTGTLDIKPAGPYVVQRAKAAK